MLQFKFIMVYVCLGIFSLVVEGLSEANDASLLWGPYRPNLYVGIRPRIQSSLVAGLMWSNADNLSSLLTSTDLRDSTQSWLLLY